MPNFRAARSLAPAKNGNGQVMRGHAIGPAAQQALSLARLDEVKELRLLCQRLQMRMTMGQFREMKTARLRARLDEAGKMSAIKHQASRVEADAIA